MTKLQKVQYEAAFKTLRAVAAEMSDKQDQGAGLLPARCVARRGPKRIEHDRHAKSAAAAAYPVPTKVMD